MEQFCKRFSILYGQPINVKIDPYIIQVVNCRTTSVASLNVEQSSVDDIFEEKLILKALGARETFSFLIT